MDFFKVAAYNFFQKSLYDRIFYVPFWECPYECSFCCVDSLPGKPPLKIDAGEEKLLELIDKLYEIKKKPIQLHVYGGEPMLKPSYMEHIARLSVDNFKISRFYLYSTLRAGDIFPIVKAAGKNKIRIIVNPSTANDKVRDTMGRLNGIAEWYKNATVFPTGRAKQGSPSYRKSLIESIVPKSFPGRACFANISGMLVNGAHGTVHLCCLPQSPVVGTIDEKTDVILQRYRITLKSWYREILLKMRKDKISHACSVCQSLSDWNTKLRPNVSYLDSLPEGTPLTPELVGFYPVKELHLADR
ncbi:radical SAM protein [Leptospira sp. 'Mane']|uniref:radical SAM protein n=1 Tax=Leptospira sp. 'Mane' TaxID=3387407 RepID=UPI00398A7D75